MLKNDTAKIRQFSEKRKKEYMQNSFQNLDYLLSLEDEASFRQLQATKLDKIIQKCMPALGTANILFFEGLFCILMSFEYRTLEIQYDNMLGHTSLKVQSKTNGLSQIKRLKMML